LSYLAKRPNILHEVGQNVNAFIRYNLLDDWKKIQ